MSPIHSYRTSIHSLRLIALKPHPQLLFASEADFEENGKVITHGFVNFG